MTDRKRLVIEDTGIGLAIDGDAGYPGVRLWKVVEGAGDVECYLATRSIFARHDDLAKIETPKSITTFHSFTAAMDHPDHDVVAWIESLRGADEKMKR